MATNALARRVSFISILLRHTASASEVPRLRCSSSAVLQRSPSTESPFMPGMTEFAPGCRTLVTRERISLRVLLLLSYLAQERFDLRRVRRVRSQLQVTIEGLRGAVDVTKLVEHDARIV